MRSELIFVPLGFLEILISVYGFFISEYSLYLFVTSFGAFLILLGLFGRKNYINVFYLGFLGVLMFQGIILTYTYLFSSAHATEALFYISLLFFVFCVIFFVCMFTQRNKGEELIKEGSRNHFQN